MGHPAFMIEFGHGTHTGLRRTRNEDTYYADAGLGLFLVVDGMGGHQHGEVASATARDGVVARVAAGQSLIDAIQRGERGPDRPVQRAGRVAPHGDDHRRCADQRTRL